MRTDPLPVTDMSDASFCWCADGVVKLTESAVVVEYLDTAYPDAGPKLFPKDARLLAKVPPPPPSPLPY